MESDPAPLRPAAAARAGCASRSPRRSTRCAAPAQPGVLVVRGLSCAPRCAWRWSRTSATSRSSTRSSTRSSRWCGSATTTPGTGTATRTTTSSTTGAAGVVHAVRGAQRRPRSRATSTASRPTSGTTSSRRTWPQQYNLHQEANKIDLAALTDEIVLSKEQRGDAGREPARVEIVRRPAARRRAARRPRDVDRHQRRRRPHRSPNRTRCWAGSTNWTDSRRGRRGRRRGAAPPADRACWRTCREALKRHLEALLALEHQVVEAPRAARARRRSTGSPRPSAPSSRTRCAGWRAACTAR